MYLKRITAYGFKSFADRIDLAVEPGITAVVGPNGSGKSNITDAIRWVLGEQNVRNLRAHRTEDIVFAGSTLRQPLGVAEVSLHFDNEDGRLAVGFSEVVITRRYFRSGDSECFINKVPCRLKDIYLLFADTGIGREGISIIGQNKIDEILNSRPEDRRLFFEDAAGITKFRSRRREAMKKLDDTEANLDRVTDLISEIDTQLAPLAEEARKTREYNALNEIYTKGRITQILNQYAAAQRELDKLAAAMNADRDEEIALSAAIDKAEAEKAQAGQKILAIEERFAALNGEVQDIANRIKDKESDIRSFDEKTSAETAALAKAQENFAAKERQSAAIDDDLAEFASLGEEYAQQEKEQNAAIEADRQAAKASRLALTALATEYQAMSEAHQAILDKISTAKKDLEILDKDIDRETIARAKSEEAQKSLAAEIATIAADAAEKAEQQKKLDENLTVLADKNRALTAAIRRNQDALKKISDESRTVRQFVSQSEAKLQVLVGAQESYEGFGRAPRAILAATEPWRRGVEGAVAELFQMKEEFITAIEVALGAAQQYIITADIDTAKAAIEYLKINRFGRVTFLPLSTIKDRQPLSLPPQVKNLKGYLGIACEHITTAPKYEIAARFLLSQTIIADDFDHAMAIARAVDFRHRIVTLEGEVVNAGGSVAGGVSKQAENSFLNRRKEIQTIERVLAEKKEQAAALIKRENELVAALAADNEALKSGQEERQSKLIKFAEIKTALAAQQDKQREKEQQLEKIIEAAKVAGLSFSEAKARRLELLRQLQDAEAEKLDSEEKLHAKRLERQAADAAGQEIAEAIHEKEKAAAVLHQQIISLKEKGLLKRREQAAVAQEIAAHRAEIEELSSLLAKKDERKSALEDELAALEGEHAAKKREADAQQTQKLDILASGQQIEADIRNLSRDLAAVRQRMQRDELKCGKLEMSMDEAVKTLAETYQTDLAAAELLRLEMSAAELDRTLKSTNQQIEDLGAINPRAIEAYDELNGRRTFLFNQAEDLNTAKTNLLGVINAIDAEMTQRLNKAFTAIKKYFNDCFTKLFGGGQADLILTEPSNLLATGVDLAVTIPGKKRQNLAALSGGERALTVIALLFAVLCFAPSPLAVLDEIDAPLDEANIARFGEFLREFSENTQFIIVTHRKGTMAACDTLYGVTLEEAGVSKIISVKFEDRLENGIEERLSFD